MHVRELVELATILSAHGPALIRSGETISDASIEQYWVTSKVRLDRWAWRIRRFQQSIQTDAKRRRAQCTEIQGVLEEILASEMLTRVWTAVLCAYDRYHGTDRAEPVARSVLIGQMEARHRVLMLLVRSPGLDADVAIKLNRLRRRVERWTDVLIAHLLLGANNVLEFAFDCDRARDFYEDMRQRGQRQGGRHVWPLLLASLRAAFRQGLRPACSNPDLNARIAASILSCFPSELFHATGLPRSLWMLRLTSAADETQGMIDELLALESSSKKEYPKPGAIRSERLRRFGD